MIHAILQAPPSGGGAPFMALLVICFGGFLFSIMRAARSNQADDEDSKAKALIFKYFSAGFGLLALSSLIRYFGTIESGMLTNVVELFGIVLIVIAAVKYSRVKKTAPANPLGRGVLFLVTGTVIFIIHLMNVFNRDGSYEYRSMDLDKTLPMLGIIFFVLGGIFLAKGLSRKSDAESYQGFQNQSVADELLKLQDLLKQNALTQEEFDEQKKKLLSK